MKLFDALRASDRAPLDALLLAAHWDEADKARFFSVLAAASDDAGAAMRLDRLHRFFPQLGASVRCWPRLAERLEDEAPRLVSRARSGQVKYRMEIHVSLWKIFSELPGLGWSNERIAGVLEAARL